MKNDHSQHTASTVQTASATKSPPVTLSAHALTTAAMPYSIDAWQRTVLFWDTLRERGNDALAHAHAGKPPVLAFDYDIIVDGRELEPATAYALLRIKPPADLQPDSPVDARKRPFVIIDPRAGHGPGVGGFKIDSQVGIALRMGHPCYFISFFPEPCAGQTIEAVAQAEAVFLQKVNELHPDAPGKPFVIGNCQGGWALVLVAATAPELVGPILLAGTPLSYWAGVEGLHPMRYTGGLLGGSWMNSLAGDLGNGIFDGASLVSNFEQLNPANSFWSKWYDLYAHIDTDRERFLEFEKWWSAPYLLTKEEMEWIVQELFVGNKLSAGEIQSADGHTTIDMRKIRTPIIVFASWADNITPPQQALNWIPDLYADVDEIRAHEQVIIYSLHQTAGHLGIFVSGSVACRETSELISGLDLIDMLPPGLYEAKIEDAHPDMANPELLEGRFLLTFEPRTIDDILALDDGREDEQAFEVVRRVSEINQRLYDRYGSPVVRSLFNEINASWMRAMHPTRLGRYAFSDMNPAMIGVKALAQLAQAQRQRVDADNPFSALERNVSALIVAQLNRYRDQRDAMYEKVFKAVYSSPWLAALVGIDADANASRRPPAQDSLREAYTRLKIESLQTKFEHGDALDAWVRIVLYQMADNLVFDERPFNLLRRIATVCRPDQRPAQGRLKEAVKEQTALMLLDAERAINALPQLLPGSTQRREAIGLARTVASAKGPLSADQEKRFVHMEAILQIEPEPTKARPAARRAPAKPKRVAP